ncbi:MAG TPA: response regulator transcription factor [Gaiellaceae bacterium]|nr:response regulator transcription factor [Gaiellaceae bacterium]
MSTALVLAAAGREPEAQLERRLAGDGFHVLRAGADGEALELVERGRPDLVLVGEVELCARLREGEPGRCWNREVPVIVLGPERAGVAERVRAFARGADDWVGTPVVYDELAARIRAVLRRAAPPPPARLEVDGLVIDRASRTVTVAGAPVAAAGKEFELLAKLASEPRRVFTKDELLRDVWGYRTASSRTRTLDSHASRLRRRLADAAADERRFVVNVWGVGYKLLE